MMIAGLAKRALRLLGVDVRRYSPQSSDRLKLARLLTTYEVDCVFDVGANVGQYGRELREIGYRKRIISFEPVSDAHAQLVKNSRLDPDWVVAPPMALGTYDGCAWLNVSANSTCSSLLDMGEKQERLAPTSKYVKRESIAMRRLDSVFSEYVASARRPFLKIDSQGFEPQVLRGAASCLERFVGVQAELSLTELYVGQELFLEVALPLCQSGFQLVGLFPGFTDLSTGQLLQVDGIFFR